MITLLQFLEILAWWAGGMLFAWSMLLCWYLWIPDKVKDVKPIK